MRVTIVVPGRLSERLASAFPELLVGRLAGETVLSGPVSSQRLREVLGQLRDLGIEPVSVDVDD
jgi:hypothetical protein